MDKQDQAYVEEKGGLAQLQEERKRSNNVRRQGEVIKGEVKGEVIKGEVIKGRYRTPVTGGRSNHN